MKEYKMYGVSDLTLVNLVSLHSFKFLIIIVSSSLGVYYIRLIAIIFKKMINSSSVKRLKESTEQWVDVNKHTSSSLINL